MLDRTPLLAVLLLFVLAPVSGSLVEDTTGGAVSYQFDGDSHHDAPDACADATTAHAVAVGNRTDGLLLPVEDEADHFLLDVNASTVGMRLSIDAVVAQVNYDVRVNVLAPDCLGTIFDPENQPAPPIQDPVPGEGQQLVVAQDGQPVCSDRWFWVLNQVGKGHAPQTIHVTWTDGSQEDVRVEHSTDGVLHYTTAAHSDVTVLRATAVVDDDWTGRFILSERFCDAEDGDAVFGEPSERLGDTVVEFTPIRTGQHIISVVLVSREPEPPMAVPAVCHFCVDGLDGPLEPLLYDLGSVLS